MRFATDTGGTFTDLIVEDDDGQVRLYKAPTVPADPVAGVLAALEVAAQERRIELRELLGQADMFIHGTTHALNAIITGNTARTALLVSEGHRDILTFREGGRLEPFNHSIPYPKPFVPRALTVEVKERVLASGEILAPLDEAHARRVLEGLRAEGVEAVAVALLWSTVNPCHEQRLGALIEEVLPGTPYTLSHAVNATLREFRRASSAAIDASLKPLMSRYLAGLTERLATAGFGGTVMVLTSSGGMVTAAEAAASPIRVINSGPSMAPVAGRHYAAREGSHRSAIVADTGGTTYDISLVRDGTIPMTRDLWIGLPFRGHLAGYPSVDVSSVGAGGGSIAAVDSGGLLHVGPQSAGSTPGPACYGRGGTRPTVTDACVVLGYLDPEYFLGGRMRLDAEAAREAIRRNIAEPLGLSLEEAAWSILDLATENMVQAIQDITVNQGIDPAEAVLVGGGGAAGLNSVFIARRLGCSSLLIPETGAALSAAGAMMSEVGTEYAATIFSTGGDFDAVKVNSVLDDLRSRCEKFAARAEVPRDRTAIGFVAEARYEGQAWDIDVPLGVERFVNDADVATFREAFHRAHETIFTFRDVDSVVELVGLRAHVRCSVRRSEAFRLDEAATGPGRETSRRVYFDGPGWLDTPVYRLSELAADHRIQGPALVESPFTTVVIDPGAAFHRSRESALLIEANP